MVYFMENPLEMDDEMGYPSLGNLHIAIMLGLMYRI
jgi:hypothetical protein